ncbi:hypothetical protein, partial [Candidatus Protochlamydia phocaeensis]|uniref:hypothetical protein n=1 Tax=Candidatus Protochlamydia phocaeensis TaxID=1414722 RepID=UPI000A9208CF
LEEKYGGRIWETKQEIINEVSRLSSQQVHLKQTIQKDYQLSSELSHRIAHQLILEEAAKCKNTLQVEEIKQVISNLPSFLGNRQAYSVDKSLADALSLGMGQEDLKKNIQNDVIENSDKMHKQTQIEQDNARLHVEQNKQSNRAVERSL